MDGLKKILLQTSCFIPTLVVVVSDCPENAQNLNFLHIPRCMCLTLLCDFLSWFSEFYFKGHSHTWLLVITWADNLASCLNYQMSAADISFVEDGKLCHRKATSLWHGLLNYFCQNGGWNLWAHPAMACTNFGLSQNNLYSVRCLSYHFYPSFWTSHPRYKAPINIGISGWYIFYTLGLLEL